MDGNRLLLKNITEHETEDVYLFIVEPADSHGFEDEEWAGRVTEITRRNEQVVRESKQELSSKFKKIDTMMEANA